MNSPIYAHRPSKDVTRQIFVDSLHQLAQKLPIRDFQYIGFGALEFIDFDEVHRSLGIHKMYSIENDLNIERYEANKPYRCIELLGGHSTDMLTRVDWNELSIVWLDYESALTEQVLTDVQYLCTKLVPGSVLAVTLNAHPGPLDGRRDRLAANIGASRVPAYFDSDDRLGGSGWAKAQQQVLFSTLRNKLQKRPDSATWWQTINLIYKDNAQMQLVAGVICTPVLKANLEAIKMESLPYYQPSSGNISVAIPYLTAHEQRLLRKKLPISGRRRIPVLPGVSSEQVSSYCDYYQWIRG